MYVRVVELVEKLMVLFFTGCTRDQCGQIATRNKKFDFSWILVYEKQKEAADVCKKAAEFASVRTDLFLFTVFRSENN